MNTTTIGVKEAVQAAINYLQDLQSVIVPSKILQDLRLEEVELSETRSKPPVTHWLVTLSFSLPDGLRVSREYKIFTIDAANGKVQSMKIREL